MIQVVKSRFKAKVTTYSHAYDEYNNLISIDDAMNLDSRTYYRYRDKEIELINNFNGNKKGCYWSCKPNQYVTINGKQYAYSEDKDSESPEHKSAKAKVIINKYFTYKSNKVIIIDPVEEKRIEGSLFVSDIKAKLPDGTYCIIEIIKTSDLSDEKLEHLENNEILTFKIYIDEYGNQEHNRDSIVGNKELGEIKKRIRDGEGKLAELKDQFETARKEGKDQVLERVSICKEYLIDRADRIRKQIESIKRECESITEGNSSEVNELERRIRFTNNQIAAFNTRIGATRIECENTEQEIEDIENKIRWINRRKSKFDDYESVIRRKIKSIEEQSASITNQFNALAENCSIEWFRNKWITAPVQNKIQEIKYWTT